MKTFAQTFRCRILTIAALSFLGIGILSAQNQSAPGDFDPAQQRQRMMDRYREQLEVKDEAEWKIIVDRITKINENRRFGGGRGLGGPGGGGPGGPGGGGGGGFNRPSDPNAEALQKAIESKASAEEVKAKLAQLRAARKEAEAKRLQAQEELRVLLSVRQEAIAVQLGLLN